MKVVLTDVAVGDLDAIADYVAKEAPDRAAALVDALLDRCASLSDMPARYPLVPRYEASGIRRQLCGHYLIFYRIGEEAVEIVHVLHGAMDYEAILFPTD